MVVQQTFLSQALPNRMRTNTGFPSATSTGNAMVVGANAAGSVFLNHQARLHQTTNPKGSHMMSHLISQEAHGFATPPPSVMPSTQNTPIDNGQPQFLTPTSTTSLFGCQQVPELNHTRVAHSPAITPPEHPSGLDAKLLSAAAAAATSGTTSTSQAAALNAFHQTLAAATASGQINGNSPQAVSAMLALNQLLSTPAGATAMAQNPMLIAAMTALNNGANWQHPSVLPALLSILHQNYDPQGFAAIQAALLQEAQLSQHRQLFAQLQQHQAQMAVAAAAAALNQDQISMEKAVAAAAAAGDPRLISHPQWMSPPLSSNTPASSSSPLLFSADDTGVTAGTSNANEENTSPMPRGDVYHKERLHSFDVLADYNRWDCDDVQRILTEQNVLSEKESIAVAVLAGLASIR